MAGSVPDVDDDYRVHRNNDPQLILELERLRSERDDQAAIIRGELLSFINMLCYAYLLLYAILMS